MKFHHKYAGNSLVFRLVIPAIILSLLLTACSAGGGYAATAGGGGTPPTPGPSPGPSPDTTPPTVSITAPTTGPSYDTSNSSVSVSVLATDNIGLSQITWTNNKGGSGAQSASGTSRTSTFNIALQSGSNVITVSAVDTSGNHAERQLTVNYTPPPSNSARLTWGVVGSPVLAGYRIYYGTSPGVYLQTKGLGVNAGNNTTYTVLGLSSGTRYYFAVTAFDTNGNESDYSNEAFKDIP